MSDFYTLLKNWDMSDATLSPFRTDEGLALAPLCIFDEVGPTTPLQGFLPATMNDYTTPVADSNGYAAWTYPTGGMSPGAGWTAVMGQGGTWTPTFQQRAWQDPNDYFWQYTPNGESSLSNNGQPGPPYYTGTPKWTSANIVTPQRTGQIISHNPAGYDNHFWYGYTHYARYCCPTNVVNWVPFSYGGYSPLLNGVRVLPATTMRWMDHIDAQYDPILAGTVQGNYPQSFINAQGGVITGAKYCAATQPWPATNYGRPCGPDRYAVDQQSVCCVTAASIVSSKLQLTVTNTQNADAPGAAGGLQVNDYIIVDGGSYPGTWQITSISGSGPWAITCTSQTALDGLPTGFTMSTDGATYADGTHVGRLRWPTYTGICGRAAITTMYGSGTLTITPTAAGGLPWLRATLGAMETVDIWDAGMTTKVTISNLVRVSDTSFTASISNPAFTPAWIVHSSVTSSTDWQKYSSASKLTGVVINWSFNQRAAAPGYTSPPTWYAGITGCTAASVTQFNYSKGSCRAVVGIVPFYSGSPTGGGTPTGGGSPPPATPLEQFGNQVMFQMPDTFQFDDVYGAHAQAAIMLTMPDPFYETPFAPSCGGAISWTEDAGCGDADSGTSLFYPHHPLVEASSVPAYTLPSGVTLFYDPAHNAIAPPFYPTGIPIADGLACSSGDTSAYGTVETDWGFACRACATINGSGRWAGFYSNFVTCTGVVNCGTPC